MARKPIGRPPKYETKEQIEGLIEEYFKSCDGYQLKDEKGNPVLNKWGDPVIVNQKPPTVTGLALALGFSTRLSLLNYQAKAEFMNTITRAKSMIEQYAEERLFDRDGVNGARFSLVNNFKGWGEKVPTELDIEEQIARIEQLKAQTKRIDGAENAEELEKLDKVLEEIKGVV